MKRKLVCLVAALAIGLVGAVAFAQDQTTSGGTPIAEIPAPPPLNMPELTQQQAPDSANYFSAGREWPPVPFNPYDGLTNVPIYFIKSADRKGGMPFLLFDDRSIVAVEVIEEAAREREALMRPMNKDKKAETTGSTEPKILARGLVAQTNDLLVDIVDVTNGIVSLNILNPTSATNNPVWDVWKAIRFSTNPDNWTWIARTEPGQTNMLIALPSATEAYFRLGATNNTHSVSNVPDWWMSQHFGHVLEWASDHSFPTDDYDGDGISNYAEFLAGTDPNTISFQVTFNDTFTASTTPAGSAKVRGGHPGKYVKLVDTDPHTLTATQVNALSWQSCPAGTQAGSVLSITPTLSADGWHTVWVGMVGRAPNLKPTWNSFRLKLDRAAPVVHVTTPATLTSTVPYRRVQIVGYADEKLSKVTYDITNSSQSIAGMLAFVTGETDTRSDFQAFDVQLAPGAANALSLHVWDRAGNQTTKSLSLTVDPNTPAPVDAGITWPANGVAVASDLMTVVGAVGDPSSTVTATITDAQGQVRTLIGRVDRNGHYYIESVPVHAGQSVLAVTVTDGVGRTVTTTRTVQRSGYTVTPTIGNGSGDLSMVRLEADVGGSITTGGSSLPNITSVTVNGTNAPLSGQNWGPVTVSAVGSQAGFELHVVLTPETGPAVQWNQVYLKPPRVRMGMFKESYDDGQQNSNSITRFTYELGSWSDNTTSQAQETIEQSGTPGFFQTTTYSFPPDRFFNDECWHDDYVPSGSNPTHYRNLEPGVVTTPSKRVTYVTQPTGGGCTFIPDILACYRDIALDWQVDEVSRWLHHKSEFTLVLETAGWPGEWIPFQLDLGLAKINGTNAYDWSAHCPLSVQSYIYSGESAPADGVDLGSLGKTDPQGRLWLMLPANAHIEVTPKLDSVLERITAVEATSGRQFRWAAASVTPTRPFNVTIDSDNDGTVEPDGNDDRVEETGKGQLIMVNAGDEDRDGFPNWADFEISEPNKTFGTLGTMSVRVPGGTPASQLRLRFKYPGSDPATIDYAADPLVPAEGKLRLWKSATSSLTTRLKQSAPAGDYVKPDQAYSLADLGYPAPYPNGPFDIELRTEAVRPSTAAGDIQVTAELDPDGDGPFGYCQLDTVRITAIGVELVEATGDTTVAVRNEISDSHPSPYFVNPTITQIESPHPNNDGTKLVSSFSVSGTVRSALCDLIPDENGRLASTNLAGEVQGINLSLNGEPLPKPAYLTYAQSKQTNNQPAQSFQKPFPTSTTFTMVFTNVEVSTGVNFLRMAATDKVPGVGLTGFAELTWDVGATQNIVVAFRAGTDLTPITMSVLPMQLNFGSSVTSIQNLQASVPVQLHLEVKTNEMAASGEWQVSPEFTGDLHVVESTLTNSAILLTNTSASVIVYGRDKLDQFLHGNGTPQDLVAQVSVPSRGLTNVVARLRADGTAAGKLRHEFTATQLTFQTNGTTGVIQSVGLVAQRVGTGTVTKTLARTGTTDTFVSADGLTTATFSSPVDAGLQASNSLALALSDTALGLSIEPVAVQRTGAGTGSFQTDNAPGDQLPGGATDPGYNAYDGWSFWNDPWSVLAKSIGGEAHIFYQRFVGPADVLTEQAAQFPDKFVLMPDGHQYVPTTNPNHPLACHCGCKTPEAHIVAALKKARPMPPPSVWDLTTEHAGYVAGFGLQAWDDVGGLWDLAKMAWKYNPQNPEFAQKAANSMLAYRAVSIGNATTEQTEFVAKMGTSAEKISAFMEGTWKLWLMAEQSQWGTLKAAASCDWDEAYRQSETMRWMNAYMVELAVAFNNEITGKTAYERGVLKGRISLEVLLILIPYADLAEIGKVAMLDKLSKVGWVAEDSQLGGLVGRLLEVAKGNKAVPPVIGVPAFEFAAGALKAGTEAGSVAERIWGRALVKMEAGMARRRAFLEAMCEVAANGGDRVVVIRLKEIQDLLLSRAPTMFADSQEARTFFEGLFTYNDYLALKATKKVVVIETQSEFIVLDGARGFRGHHILKKEMLEALAKPPYNIPVGDVNATPIKILTQAEHTGPGGGESFHARLNGWANGVLGDVAVKSISDLPQYQEAYKVVDEYLRFLKAYPEYADMQPVVRAFAKMHSIPITE